MSSPPDFALIRAEVPWVLPDGKPTTYFFRMILNMFNMSGGGQGSSLAAIVDYVASQNPHGGTDRDRELADLTTLLQSQPSEAGRVASLEARVALLERLLAEAMRPRADLAPLIERVDKLTSVVLGAH